MTYCFTSRSSKRTGARTLFLVLAFVGALTILPTIAHAQLQSNSVAATRRVGPNIDSQDLPPSSLQAQTKTTAKEFGAVAQSAMNVFAGVENGSLGGNAHACAGTQGMPPSPSTADASSGGSLTTRIRIVSSTLPVGTRADIDFSFRAKRNPRIKADIKGQEDALNATVTAYISVAGAADNQVGAVGRYVTSLSSISPTPTDFGTGLFGSETMVTQRLIGAVVGFDLNFVADLGISTRARAAGFGYTSIDITAGIIWGAQPLTAGVSLVYGPSNSLFPSLSNVTEPNLDAAIPPFQLPIDSGFPTAVPEPTALGLMAVGMGVMCLVIRRRCQRDTIENCAD